MTTAVKSDSSAVHRTPPAVWNTRYSKPLISNEGLVSLQVCVISLNEIVVLQTFKGIFNDFTQPLQLAMFDLYRQVRSLLDYSIQRVK